MESEYINYCSCCNSIVAIGDKKCRKCGAKLVWTEENFKLNKQPEDKFLKNLEKIFLHRKVLFAIIVTVIIVSFVTPFSPAIMLSEEGRINKTIDFCNGSEDGFECKVAQAIYSTTFKYCNRMGEVYGVAWSGHSEQPPEFTDYGPYSGPMPNLYHSCRDHIKRN